MVAVLYRVRSRLRSRWLGTVALVVVVAVLGGAVLTLVAGAVRTLSAPDRYVRSRDSAFDVSLEQLSGRPRTAELLALPAIEHIDTVTFLFAGLVPEGSDPSERADGISFAGDQAAFGTRVVEGREPRPDAPTEFAATRSWADVEGASIGDRFDLWVIPQEPASALGFDAADQAYRLATTTLVGIVDGPASLQEGFTLTVFPASVLDAGDVGISASSSVASLAPGATTEDLRAQLDALPEGTEFGIDPGDWVPEVVRQAVSAEGQGLVIVAAIVGVATVVVLGQLLSRQVRLGELERMALSSMGVQRGQVMAESLLSALVPVVAGAAAAVAIAYAASSVFPIGFVDHVEPAPGRHFAAGPLLLGALALALAIGAWVTIALVAGGAGRRRGRGAPAVDVVARRLPARVATGLRFAFARQPGDAVGPRTAIVGTVAVLAVLVGSLTFGTSMRRLVSRPVSWGEDYDMMVGQGGGELPADARAALEADPEIEALTLYGTVLTSVEASGFDVTGLIAVRGSTTAPLFEGRQPVALDELAIGRVAARRFGVGVGDTLVVTSPTGTHTMRVTGVGMMPAGEGGDGVGEGGVVTFDALRGLDPSVVPTGAQVRVGPGVSPAEVAARFTERSGMSVTMPLEKPPVIVNVDRVRSVPYVIAAILAILVLVNLAHQLIVSTQRRRRDLAVLRTLGADGRWTSGVVHCQVTLFTLVVALVGLPLGTVAGRLAYRSFVGRIGALEAVTVPLGFLGATLAGLVVLANLVAAPNARTARRRAPARTLAQE